MVTSEGLQEVIEEVPPLVTFRSMSKQPDQCLGGYCQWFRFDDQSKCVMADILTSDSQCPQGRWRLLKSETLNQKSETCIVCSSTDWWRIKNQNTEWICAVCHPPILSENFCEKK